VEPAIALLSGAEAPPLPFVEASLAESLHEKPGLAHFLPATLTWNGSAPQVRALKWQGSGDIATLAKANCFLLVPAEKQNIAAGERVSLLVRKDVV
jgi:molybdopterin molybdotransferase